MAVPPYRVVLGEIAKQPPGVARIAVPETFLRFLLQRALQSVEFQEAEYLRANADVRAGVAAGSLPSGKAHYVVQGYFEGRDGAAGQVDEAWYLAQYPDVAQAVRTRKIASAAAHYASAGAREGRAPNAVGKAELDAWMAALAGAAPG